MTNTKTGLTDAEFAAYEHKGHEWRMQKLLADEREFAISYLDKLDLTTSIMESAELHREWLVLKARQNGATWTEIGNAIGRTKQAAQLRYGAKKPRATNDPQQTTIDEAIGAHS